MFLLGMLGMYQHASDIFIKIAVFILMSHTIVVLPLVNQIRRLSPRTSRGLIRLVPVYTQSPALADVLSSRSRILFSLIYSLQICLTNIWLLPHTRFAVGLVSRSLGTESFSFSSVSATSVVLIIQDA